MSLNLKQNILIKKLNYDSLSKIHSIKEDLGLFPKILTISNSQNKLNKVILAKSHQSTQINKLIKKSFIDNKQHISNHQNIITTVKSKIDTPKVSKQESINNFILNKKWILISKLRIKEKKENLKEIQEQINYQDHHHYIKIDDLKFNTIFIKSVIESQKQEIENVQQEYNIFQINFQSKNKNHNDLKNQISNKETSIKLLEFKIKEYKIIKKFIKKIYKTNNKNFNEEYFLYAFQIMDVIKPIDGIELTKLKSGNNYHDSIKKTFYLTRENDHKKRVSLDLKGNQIQSIFIDMLKSVEFLNFIIFKDLNEIEFKNIELQNNLNNNVNYNNTNLKGLYNKINLVIEEEKIYLNKIEKNQKFLLKQINNIDSYDPDPHLNYSQKIVNEDANFKNSNSELLMQLNNDPFISFKSQISDELNKILNIFEENENDLNIKNIIGDVEWLFEWFSTEQLLIKEFASSFYFKIRLEFLRYYKLQQNEIENNKELENIYHFQKNQRKKSKNKKFKIRKTLKSSKTQNKNVHITFVNNKVYENDII